MSSLYKPGPRALFALMISSILCALACSPEEPRLLVDYNIRQLGDVRLSAGPEIRCAADADCPGGLCWFPDDGQYHKGFCRDCLDDADCPAGLSCDHRFCHMVCQSSDACQPGERCAGGFCRAEAVAEVVLCNAGGGSLELHTDRIELACSDGDCGLLSLRWLSEATPLELEPGACTALQAGLALPDLGPQQVLAVLPTGDPELARLPLVFCARAVEAVCAPGLDDPGCEPEPGCELSSCCDTAGIIALAEQTSLGTPACDPGDTVWQCVQVVLHVMLDTYPLPPDRDQDGLEDDFDNCPFAHNRDQVDRDGDGWGDPCDNCAEAPNEGQQDMDGDSIGDACDPDTDGDGVDDGSDNCPDLPNPGQDNADADGPGDVCDPDIDGDQVLNPIDNCPMFPNPDQLESDPLTIGEACFADHDGDGVLDHLDNCMLDPNPGQENLDGDALGDLCDADRDEDGVGNGIDNCPDLANPDQVDRDDDFFGDFCDARPDEGYCYLAFRPEDCLDAAGPLELRVGADRIRPLGEQVDLALWINRPVRAIAYTWSVASRPSGSTAEIQNPAGMSAVIQPYYPEYATFEGWQPSFTPDQAGTYVIQVSVQLAFEDRLFPEHDAASGRFELRVE
ncbi:MAG: thrombospondin type 3 repeat-containing protein [Deltaproteobacteria bacterium]|nr:thrombospondin type 3 repeat-containing protein [Deltaproteobacteria bacterium]